MRISDWSSDVCSSDLVKNFIIIIQVLLTEQTGLAGHKKYQSSCSVSLGGCLGCFRTSSGKLSLGEMKRLGEGCCTAEVYNMVILPNVSFPLQHPQCWKGLQPESQPSPQASVSSAPLSAQQVSSFAGRTSMHAA